MDKIARMMKALARDKDRLDASRAALHGAIREALAAGVKQSAIARETGYSREYLRKIAQEG